MRRLFVILSVIAFTHLTAAAGILSKEYRRETIRLFPVGLSPELFITNEFGTIRIIEGSDKQISFRIIITGKGKNDKEAKLLAESVDVEFKQTGNRISAKTGFEKIQCNNCGRSVEYEVTVPRGVRMQLTNKFGDIALNNTREPIKVDLQFGKLYANELSDAHINMQHGGGTINKCKHLELNSSFSKYKFGEIGALSAAISYDGFEIEELGRAELKSGFSNMEIKTLNDSFIAPSFSYGNLTIKAVNPDFSRIKVDAGFSKIIVGLTKKHNFNVSLFSQNGSVNTKNISFNEKSSDKQDQVVGIAGSQKNPTATVTISNSYGNIEIK